MYPLAPPRHIHRVAPDLTFAQDNTHVQRLNRVRIHGHQRHPWRLPPLEGGQTSPTGPPVQAQLAAATLRGEGAAAAPPAAAPRVVCRRGAVDAPSIAEPLLAVPRSCDLGISRIYSSRSIYRPVKLGGSAPVAGGRTRDVRLHCIV